MRPGQRARIARRCRPDRLAQQRRRTVAIAGQPAHVRCAHVGLIERPQIGHPLVGIDGGIELSLLHQRIAEQAEIERLAACAHQAAGDGFGFGESMPLVQEMTFEQQGSRVAGGVRLETSRRLFGAPDVLGAAGGAGAHRQRGRERGKGIGRTCGGRDRASPGDRVIPILVPGRRRRGLARVDCNRR